MKEAIGGTWLFTLVIAFIALFTTFVSVSTNYSRCYKIKDEILLAIERNHGLNENSLTTINSYLNGIGYSSVGECPNDGNCWYGFSTNDNRNIAGYGTNTNYCVRKYTISTKTNAGGNTIISGGPIGHPDSAYYEVVVFFRLDWPILNQFFNIKISGETSVIFMLNDIPAVKNNDCR